MSIMCDVCAVDSIYGNGFEYSLPKDVLEGFLSGKAFDNCDEYTADESQRLREDIREIYQRMFSFELVKEPLAVITAGAPGAGKTTLLRRELENNNRPGRCYAYIDPDDVCLRAQARTYQADLEGGDRLAVYNKWRPGSNAAAHLVLANLIRENYAFYFGTTATGPATGKFLEFLKQRGYQIRLLHVTAPDDVRCESIKERDKTFVQTTEQDVRAKGDLLPQRINDTFLAYADEIEFYYREAVHADAQFAAKWVRNQEGTEALGILQIIDPFQYAQIKAIHNAVVERLERPDLQWGSTGLR